MWSTAFTLLTFSTWAFLGKKMADLGRGWKLCVCLHEREQVAHAGAEPCVQVLHTTGKGQRRCLPAWALPGQRLPEDGALLPKSGRNLPISRVSERPPRSKTRGEPAWGGRLAGTAENSGPDPKPIKINGNAPTSCRDTWHRAPPDTAHLWLSPGKLHVPMQSVHVPVGGGRESPWPL